MSLNPLNVLKRKLDDDSTPLTKRLCLAKNVVKSPHFPAAPKERVVAEWLGDLMKKNKLSGEDLRYIIAWLSAVDDLTGELKSKLIEIVSKYIQNKPMNDADTQSVLSFLENEKIATQITGHIDNYLVITTTLLRYLKSDETISNITLIQKLLNNIIVYYKECRKKFEFILKLLDGENLETIFSYLNTECRSGVISVCQNILFPMNKKSFFISFLQTLVRKDNVDELINEKGDNIQSVLKIMNTFFTFPKGRSSKDYKFLCNFIDVFVSCFHSESQMIFAFYIMVTNSLNMTQSYISPAMNMPPIIFEENNDKIKRNMFLEMLKIILQNEVDINVRLTDTFGEKLSKVETKKNFLTFLQKVTMGQLKLEGKPDKITIQIVKTALKLDPVLIEQKIDKIIAPIMSAKKSLNIISSYTEMLNCLIEILFKLSRGTVFINQILPHIKFYLEAGNTEQFDLRQKVKECAANGTDCEKIKSKIVTGNDVFPMECVELYGKLTSDLMFRQNSELLVLLQKDFEEHCLVMLDEGTHNPSTIILTEVLSAILATFFEHNKMADHTVPLQIAEVFWAAYKQFEDGCLKKFGECILKLDYNPSLTVSFLKLCLSFSQLKLLNMKYGNIKLNTPQVFTTEVFDFSLLLPYLNSEQWTKLVSKIEGDEAVNILDNLLLAKMMAIEILTLENSEEDRNEAIGGTKSYLIKQVITNPSVLETSNYFAKVLFAKLERTQLKQLAKHLVKMYLNNPETEILESDAVIHNRLLLNTLVLETVKNITKRLENTELLSKALNKTDFDITIYMKTLNVKEYFNRISLNPECQDDDTLAKCVDILKQLKIHNLEQKYQLTAIFVLLALKKCCLTKKLRRSIDYVLLSLYELSPILPDLYKIFPVDYIFQFDDKCLIDLLTLKIKTSNHLLIIKSILELAVKKVKSDSEIIKNIVELLLTKRKNCAKDMSSIEYFSDPVFQITCIVLPIIAKEKRAITASIHRSILANLQESLHNTMIESFKNIDFSKYSSLLLDNTGNTDDSVVISENAMASLNAMDAYSLTLSKYCETTDAEEMKNLNCLWSGLEFFVLSAIHSVQNPESKHLHVKSSIQLLNVTLRYIKKLGSHEIFQTKDKVFLQIWRSVQDRLLMAHDEKRKIKKRRVKDTCLEDTGVTIKFLCELVSVECFVNHFINDLNKLCDLETPSIILKDEETANSFLTKHKTARYLWACCLKGNIVGQKCVAMLKLMFRTCKNLRLWIKDHYESDENGVLVKNNNIDIPNEDLNMKGMTVVKLNDVVGELLRTDLDAVSEVILAAKRITLDYKFLDSVFDLQHMVQYILGCHTVHITCDVSWRTFFNLYEGSLAILNTLLVSREELLEDRWPCYMQCYRALISCLCTKAATIEQPDRIIEEKLAETAHSIEKLTQSICKRKTHTARLAAYTVADICSWLERTAPSRSVRQHLENSVALLIQASDSTYAMAFLKRALVGSPGQTTMTNLYTMYKRYHKYVGNA